MQNMSEERIKFKKVISKLSCSSGNDLDELAIELHSVIDDMSKTDVSLDIKVIGPVILLKKPDGTTGRFVASFPYFVDEDYKLIQFLYIIQDAISALSQPGCNSSIIIEEITQLLSAIDDQLE